MPVSAVPLLTALLKRQQVYACFIDFQKAYDSQGGDRSKVGGRIGLGRGRTDEVEAENRR